MTKLSGPLLDRMDMHIEVGALPFNEISGKHSSESSDNIRIRVNNARKIQNKRFGKKISVTCNSLMSPKLIEKHCQIDTETRNLLEKSVDRLGLSARAYHRILKISRTIADLDNSYDIQKPHVAEAIQYRRMTAVI